MIMEHYDLVAWLFDHLPFHKPVMSSYYNRLHSFPVLPLIGCTPIDHKLLYC